MTAASAQGVIATGPRRGCRVVRVRGVAADTDAFLMGRLCAQVEGYNLHAATRIAANDRNGLERMARYLARPPIATDRLARLQDGRLELRLKRPWRDGTIAFRYTPHELLERLVALVPRPRRHLTRYHGVLAPAFAGRSEIVRPPCAEVEGFNIHANTRIAAKQRPRLENLCRYISRPPLSDERLQQREDGNLTLRLKRTWSDGTTHLLYSPTELIEKLLHFVPRPRCHLTLYSGVLASASGWRAHIVPRAAAAAQTPPAPDDHGPMRVVAVVTDPSSIARILKHLGLPQQPLR